jgi:hypothetical protein
MESSDIWQAFLSKQCAGCQGVKRSRNAFCTHCYHQLPAGLRSALWQRFGARFEQAYMASLSWFRTHPFQGVHRAQQKTLFEEST